MLVSGSADATVRIWSASSGFKYSAAHELSSLHSGEVTGVSVHPTGKFCTTTSADQTWAFVDLLAGSPVFTVAKSDIGGYTAGSLHPDGLLFCTADTGFQVRLWDIKSKDNVVSFGGHTAAINSIAFSENGFYLATGSADKTVKMWDLRRLADPIFASEQISGEVNRVTFDHSGQYIAVAGADIQVYSVKDSLSHVARLSGHKGSVTGVTWGADAKSVFSVSTDKTLKTFSSK